MAADPKLLVIAVAVGLTLLVAVSQWRGRQRRLRKQRRRNRNAAYRRAWTLFMSRPRTKRLPAPDSGD